MKTYNKKMFITILIIFFISMSFTLSSFGYTISQFTPKKSTSVSGTEGIVDFGNVLVTVITTIGVVASVVVLIILGIKYMLGSAEEKAQYKKSMMPYLVGSFVVFSASTIANLIYTWAK